MSDEADVAVAEAAPAEAAANGAAADTAADQQAAEAADAAAPRDGGAAQAAGDAAGDRKDREHRSSRHKERSSRRDRDEVGSRDEAARSERREHKSSRRSRDDEEGGEKKSSRHRDRDGDVSKKERKDKRDRKERSRSRERKPDRKEDRERHRSRHRSSSRERRKARRSRSRSKSRHRSSRHRSSSRHHRSRSPSRRRPRSPSEDSDDYGGYVPRRPDPSVTQEKRRDAVWSLAGAGYGSTSYMDPYGTMRGRNTAGMTPEEIKRQMQEQQLHARIAVLQQQAQSAVAAASKTQREVYIGNLVGGLVTEEALRQLFNNTMAAAFPDQMVSGLDAVVNVSMHSEGRYAFVELRTPEMASAALQLSGQVQLLGQPISVGRPSGYVDPTNAQQAAAAAAAALEQFKRGEITLEAAAAVGMPGPASPAPAAAAGATPTGQTPPGGTAASPLPGAAVAAAPAAAAPPVGPPTQYLAVSGMVTADVLADDEEYAEVIEDLRDECAKHGAVTAVTVPRPADKTQAASLFGSGNYGKGFVAFGDVASATRACTAIHGRLFAGIMVQVAYVSQQDFDAATAANAANQ